MTLAISSAIYKWFDGFVPFLVGWIAVFTVLTTARIIVLKSRGVDHAQPSSVLAELAALPLTLLQSACFVKAILAGDLFSTALFLWWGPGFWATVLYIILCKVRRRKLNWHPFRLVISWLHDEIEVGIGCMGIIEYAFSDVSALIGNVVVERGWIDKAKLVHYSLHAELDKRHAEDLFAVVERKWEDEKRRYFILQGLDLGAYIFDRLYRDLYSTAIAGS